MLSICSFPVLGFLAKSRTRSMAESIISDDDGGAADFAWSDARSVSVSPPDGRALLAGADRLIASGRLFPTTTAIAMNTNAIKARAPATMQSVGSVP